MINSVQAELACSRRFCLLQIALAVFAIINVWCYLPATPAIKGMGMLAISLYSAWIVLSEGMRCVPNAMVQLAFFREGPYWIRSRCGRWYSVVLEGESFLSPWFIILNVCQPSSGKRFRVLLCADAMDASAFRRIQILLKFI